MSKGIKIIVMGNTPLTACEFSHLQAKFGNNIEILDENDAKNLGINIESLPKPIPKLNEEVHEFRLQNYSIPFVANKEPKQKHSYKQSMKNYNKRFGK